MSAFKPFDGYGYDIPPAQEHDIARHLVRTNDPRNVKEYLDDARQNLPPEIEAIQKKLMRQAGGRD